MASQSECKLTVPSNVTELYNTIYKRCDQLDRGEMAVNTQSQVAYLLNNVAPFQQWYETCFQTIVPKWLDDHQKSLEEARKYKAFAELYKDMTDASFIAKAFDSIDKAIVYAPCNDPDSHFLFECLSFRSNLHFVQGFYSEALMDISHALELRKSFTCVERKINILLKLEMHTQALQEVRNVLKDEEYKAKLNRAQRKILKRLKKSLKLEPQKKDSLNISLMTKASDKLHLQVSDQVYLTTNTAKRVTLKAKTAMQTQSELLVEQPCLMVVRSKASKSVCNLCYKKCYRTFWPCSRCVDVVFCSKGCAQLADELYHKTECGGIGFIQAHLSNQAGQVWRTLCVNGYQKWMDTVFENKEFNVDTIFQNLHDKTSVSRKSVQEWFVQNEGRIMHRIWEKRPLRCASELVNAFMLVGLYCHRYGLESDNSFQDSISALLTIVSTAMTKTVLSEYGWHSLVNDSERIQVGNYQCLLGSMIAHSCEPNVEWSFDGQYFRVKALRRIEENEEIAISYGVSKDAPFVKRQQHLDSFMVACSCAKCMQEVKQTFAVRCLNCNGPVPFIAYDNSLNKQICIVCEQNYGTMLSVAEIYQDFKSTERLLAMLKQIDGDDLTGKVEPRMAKLACSVYIANEQFLGMVNHLCFEYINRKMYFLAICWYKWYIDLKQIHLDMSDNLFVRFANLNKWSVAFTEYLQQKFKTAADPLQLEAIVEENKQLVQICQCFLQGMLQILDLLESQGHNCRLNRETTLHKKMTKLRKKLDDRLKFFQDSQTEMYTDDESGEESTDKPEESYSLTSNESIEIEVTRTSLDILNGKPLKIAGKDPSYFDANLQRDLDAEDLDSLLEIEPMDQ